MSEKVDLLRQREQEGRSLLQMKPLDKEAYAAWSEAARAAVAACLKAGSPILSEMIAARRKITASFQTDPSYYLTQLGANLRRELATIRKCLEGLPVGAGEVPLPPSSLGTGRPSPVSRTPVASVPERQVPPPGEPGRREERGTASPPDAEAARRARARVVVAGGGSTKAEETVLAALKEWSPSPVRLLDDREALGALLEAEGERICGVVLLPDAHPTPGGDPATHSRAVMEGAFALGLLLGIAGPDRVCVLHGEEAELPFLKHGVLHVSLQDPDGWRPKVLEHFRKGGAQLSS